MVARVRLARPPYPQSDPPAWCLVTQKRDISYPRGATVKIQPSTLRPTITLLGCTLLGCMLLPAGCEPKVEKTVDGWSTARDMLRLDAHNCHASMTVLCDDRDAFIDPILQRVLDRSFHGKMPTTESQVKAVVRRCQAAYVAQQMEDEEGRRRVAEKIRKNYQNPQVKKDGNILAVLVGPVPGKFEKRNRAGFAMVPDYWSKEKDWPIAEVARFAKKFSAKYPQASLIKFDVMLPAIAAGGYKHHHWNYSKSTRRLWTLSTPTTAYFTDKINNWDAFIDHAQTLRQQDLHMCTLADKNLNEAAKGCPL